MMSVFVLVSVHVCKLFYERAQIVFTKFFADTNTDIVRNNFADTNVKASMREELIINT